MENFMESISTQLVSQLSSFVSLAPKSLDDATLLSFEQSSCESNEKKTTCDTRNYPMRSVVISNIGKDVTIDHLRCYLVDKLEIDKGELKFALLLPTGKTMEDVHFLQYKITLPEAKYTSIMCPELWPAGVRIRDFVPKKKRTEGVAVRDFVVVNLKTWFEPVNQVLRL